MILIEKQSLSNSSKSKEIAHFCDNPSRVCGCKEHPYRLVILKLLMTETMYLSE